MLKRKIGCLILCSMLIGEMLASKKTEIVPPARTVSYSTENLYNEEIFEDFEEYEIEENDDGFVINAYQTFPREYFDGLDDLMFFDDFAKVRYTETYIESESMITIDTVIDETEQPIIETINGLIAENEAGQADLLVGNDDVYWLSEVVQLNPFDDVGWWDNFKSWLSNVAVTVKTIVVKGMRLACKIAVKIVGLNNAAKVLSMYEDSYGNYHASFDCWQQYVGYNDFYDLVFSLGSSMKPCQSPFSVKDSNDRDIMCNLWGWKGDYWELGAGAELGFYKQFNSTPLWYVDKKMAIDMKMTVQYFTNKGKWETIVDWDPEDYFANPNEKQWWITGFNPSYANTGIYEWNLQVTYTIKFVTKSYSGQFDENLRDAFKAEWVNHEYDADHDHLWSYDEYTEEFTLLFQ